MRKKEITPFNVIWYNINSNKFEAYDIMPYLIERYKKAKKKPEDLKQFILSESMYQWWARCQYEIILKDWPCGTTEDKWDIYRQIKLNIDVIVQVFTHNIANYGRTKSKS